MTGQRHTTPISNTSGGGFHCLFVCFLFVCHRRAIPLYSTLPAVSLSRRIRHLGFLKWFQDYLSTSPRAGAMCSFVETAHYNPEAIFSLRYTRTISKLQPFLAKLPASCLLLDSWNAHEVLWFFFLCFFFLSVTNFSRSDFFFLLYFLTFLSSCYLSAYLRACLRTCLLYVCEGCDTRNRWYSPHIYVDTT